MQAYKTNSEDYIEDDYYQVEDMIEKAVIVVMFFVAIILAIGTAVYLKFKCIW